MKALPESRTAARPGLQQPPANSDGRASEPSPPSTCCGPGRGRGPEPLGLNQILLWALVAAGAFQIAFMSPGTSFLVIIYLLALVQMARAPTWRKAFYPGLAVGFLIGLLRLEFFWRIFSGGAVALWIVFAFWIGLFVALARVCLRWRVTRPTRFSPGWLLVPFVWCGLEYFRSELYFLRFAWLTPGFAFGDAPGFLPLRHVGTYGAGFLAMCVACGAAWRWQRSKIKGLVVLMLGAGALRLAGVLGELTPNVAPPRSVRVAGVQMEFPTEKGVLMRLTELIRKSPETQLIVLSEYTFSDPVPDMVQSWCREHRRYLIVGGKDPLPGGRFYNTAFVISPAGEIVFRQVKSVPIQFFKDGLPAPEQKLWDSPWGKIGICICYDLSYRRVTDRLIGLGAEALIVPTMDVADWGERQHKLHGRVAPIRAAEYGIPIFRVASSGISQLADRTGRVVASAPCPGDGAIISGALNLRGAGSLPLDRWLGPLTVGVTAVVILGALWQRLRARTP